jgi:diguanylate cyclase (GGDEF)-like protein
MNVLLIEDSQFYGSLVRNRLISELGAQVSWARSLAETQTLLDSATSPFLLAVVDLNLADAPNGEALDVVLETGTPAVVLSGELSDETRDAIWAKRVVDYVIKEGPQAIEYVVDLVKRLSTNHLIKVLVVDDSTVSRAHLCSLLHLHRYQVFEAESGEMALDVLKEHSDISLMLTDYNMPGMNGFQLVQAVRKTHRRERLTIIGISAFGSGYVSARFLKSGANDFLYKPSLAEEFFCRISENVRALERIRSLEEMASHDYLTGLFNRRYFFTTGQKFFANEKRGNITLALAMLDIDHFKQINDKYGHDAGDQVLRQVSAILAARFRDSDILARVGGEEFAVLLSNASKDHIEAIFDEVLRKVEALEVPYGDHVIRTTISVGLNIRPAETLHEFFTNADKLLYMAKATGRNRVICDRGNQVSGEKEC